MRIGVLGYGKLGQHIVKAVLERDEFDLAFVWNRTPRALKDVDPNFRLSDLGELDRLEERRADLIIEVCHPCITEMYAAEILKHSDYMIGSPTALADQEVENKIRAAATTHGVYIPAGAFWGGDDIAKMADLGTLQALTVSMTKHPLSMKVKNYLVKENEQALKKKKRVVLYEGSVRGLCPLAPNNVNTMAAAAIVAKNLGFDRVKGRLIADPKIGDWHVVEIDAWGPGNMATGEAFHVNTTRRNPAPKGDVTGKATYDSFLSSMARAGGKGPGVHIC